MKVDAVLHKMNNEVWSYALVVDSKNIEPEFKGKNQRIICCIGSNIKFHAALLPDGGGDFFINLNKERRKKLGLLEGQSVEIDIELDDSEYGMPMSDELREVLDQDSEADEVFHSFTPGKIRTLIYWVGNVKSSDIKIRRAIVMTEHIKKQRGIDFKLMNQELKEANQLAKLQKNL